MNTILSYLEQLDLSDIEAKLYLTLLETGPVSVRHLAEKIEIKRTTTYLYIDQLIEKGLIMKVVKGSEKLIAANDPEESLAHLVDKKLAKAKTIQQEFPQVLQAITTSLPQVKDVSEAEITSYKGITNARKIYEEALKADELRAYIRINKNEPLFPNNSAVFADAFKNNPKLKVWEIIYNKDISAPPSESSRSHVGRYFYKYMPKSHHLSSEDILIYDNKVAVINYKGGKTSIVLQSSDLYNNFKDIFTFLWDMIPETNEH